MPTQLQHRAMPSLDARHLRGTRDEAQRIKAVQREFYILMAVFLGSLTLMCIAVAISAAIMLANAGN